jgi:hypothetical protein
MLVKKFKKAQPILGFFEENIFHCVVAYIRTNRM